MFDPGIFGGAYGRRRLLKFVGSCFLKISDQEHSVCPFKCSFECLRSVYICPDDFLCEFAMLVWIASQCSHFESSAGLQGTQDPASLLSCCADHGDQFFIV